jgi:predicted RNA polymerase sigma factor
MGEKQPEMPNLNTNKDAAANPESDALTASLQEGFRKLKAAEEAGQTAVNNATKRPDSSK